MALTEQEKSIIQQVKQQGWTKQQAIEVLWQFRAKQPQQQEFKTLSQQARESLDKSPEQILWVDSFKKDIDFELASPSERALFDAPIKTDALEEVAESQPQTRSQIEAEEWLQGFVTETSEQLKQRWKNLWEIFDRQTDRNWWEKIKQVTKEKWLWAWFVESMKQSALDFWTALQTVGQLVWWGWDIAWEWVENLVQEVTPEKAENIIEWGVAKIADSDTVQQIAESYGNFRENNPETARNIEAVVNISQILPVTQWGRKIIKDVSKEVAKSPVTVPASAIRTLTPKSAAKAIAWIDNITSSELKKTTKKELREVLDTARSAMDDIQNPTPFEKAWWRATEALDVMNVQKSIAGKTKSDALKKVAQNQVEVKPLKDKFADLIGDRFNLEIKEGKIVPRPWEVATISNKDIGDLQKFFEDFKTIQNTEKITLKNLDAVVDRMQSGLNRAKLDRPWWTATSVEKSLNQFIEWDINSLLKQKAGKKFVEANSRYRDLINISQQLEKLLWVEWTRAWSLFKSLFSPQTWARSRNLFTKVKQETWIDLFKEWVLAKFAMEAVWDTRWLNLLQSVTQSWWGWIIDRDLIRKALQTVFVPEKIASKIAKRK